MLTTYKATAANPTVMRPKNKNIIFWEYQPDVVRSRHDGN